MGWHVSYIYGTLFNSGNQTLAAVKKKIVPILWFSKTLVYSKTFSVKWIILHELLQKNINSWRTTAYPNLGLSSRADLLAPSQIVSLSLYVKANICRTIDRGVGSVQENVRHSSTSRFLTVLPVRRKGSNSFITLQYQILRNILAGPSYNQLTCT